MRARRDAATSRFYSPSLAGYPQGTELTFWLATDDGPLEVTLPPQESVAFIPESQRPQAERLLQGENGHRLAALTLQDFHRQRVFGLYCRAHRQLMRLEKLRENGVTVYEGDVRPRSAI